MSTPENAKPAWAGAVYQTEYTHTTVTVGISLIRKGGFVAMWRSPETLEMLTHSHHHKAFVLLTVIAIRARYSQSKSLDGLHPGEALIGDYKKYGLTRKEYRTALAKLEGWHFVATKKTNKGTIVKLLENPIYEYDFKLGDQAKGQQRAIAGPSRGHQGATNNQVVIKEPSNKEREGPLSLDAAIARYAPLYPDKDVKGSLTKFHLKEGRVLLPAFIETWLGSEQKAVKKPRGAKHEKSKPDPTGWQEWVVENYPGAEGTAFSKCEKEHPDIVREFQHHRKKTTRRTEADRDRENTGLEYTQPIKIL